MRKIFIILITVILLITSGCSTQPRSENDVSQKPKAEESNNLEDNSNIMLYDYEESYNMSSTESIFQKKMRGNLIDRHYHNEFSLATTTAEFCELQKKYIDKKVGNVIAISKYLYQHYLEQDCNTILLPPIFPKADKKKKLIRENLDNRNVLKIVYAGALASKDYIDTLLHAIIRLNTDEVRVVIDIIGPDKMQVQKLIGNDELEKYGIYCHGRLSHDKTLSIVEKADLSVLLRMNKRYAKAGVSTKFCEAMMLGVPSICTSVGGTDLFVKDKYNGFLVRNNDLNTLETTLLSIIDLSREQIEEIKNNALITANKLFIPDKYIEQFNAFLNKCK